MSDPCNDPRPDLAAPDTEERRQFVRYLYNQSPPVRFLVRPSFQTGVGQLTDISAGGLSLVTAHELGEGAVLVVQLPRRQHGHSCTQLARVLRVTPQGKDRWLLGCKLTHQLSNEELMALLWDDAALGGGALPDTERPTSPLVLF